MDTTAQQFNISAGASHWRQASGAPRCNPWNATFPGDQKIILVLHLAVRDCLPMNRKFNLELAQCEGCTDGLGRKVRILAVDRKGGSLLCRYPVIALVADSSGCEDVMSFTLEGFERDDRPEAPENLVNYDHTSGVCCTRYLVCEGRRNSGFRLSTRPTVDEAINRADSLGRYTVVELTFRGTVDSSGEFTAVESAQARILHSPIKI
jgi:hypothetical protein